MICDKCKQGCLPGEGPHGPTPHHVWIEGLGHKEPIGAIDLCKGCAPIVRQAIEDLLRAIKKAK